MRRSLRGWYARLWIQSLLLTLVLSGCGQPVREDRSINWSKEGESVGFQHGREGVFVADKEGGRLTKIFQPGPDVLATSTPLWCPTERRAIFTSARSPGGQPAVAWPDPRRGSDPAGNLYFQQTIVYTCWMFDEKDGKPTTPVALFDAPCDHIGYVAANLAARWHPKGDRILYVKETGGHQHEIFEYDLATKRERPVGPHPAEAAIFDWTPDGTQLVCVLGGHNPGPSHGIWIGVPAQGGWWHVPASEQLTPTQDVALLEHLRSLRPAWTPDSSRFAFVSHAPGKTPKEASTYFLHEGNLTSRQVKVLTEGVEPFRDLHWAPDGMRLGVVRGQDAGTLHLVQDRGKLSPAVNREPVRQFAGWDRTGNHLAYLAPDKIPLADPDGWAFLLTPDTKARDRVFVTDGKGNDPGKILFWGMRVTFPQWSPTEDKLSLWVTFTPAFRSLVSRMLGWGLRPGDPAAVVDASTGTFHWMAVNSQEKVQVANYYLLHRDYARAWRWFDEADRDQPAPKQPTTAEFIESWQSLQGPRDHRFFEYFCLNQLGRNQEAAVKLEQFKQGFFPATPPAPKGPGPAGGAVNASPPDQFLQELLDPKELFAPLLRDLYMAEAFLSLDAAAEAEAFFQDAVQKAHSDNECLSAALVLAQVLLLEKKNAAYSQLTTDTVAPLLLKCCRQVDTTGGQHEVRSFLTSYLALYDLLPLCSTRFLDSLPEEVVTAFVPKWEALRANNPAGSASYLADLVLSAGYQRLGRSKLREQVVARLLQPPAVYEPIARMSDLEKDVRAMQKEMERMFGW